MDDVRIQIVNYRAGQQLLECLHWVEAQLREFTGSYTVAVLDNASGEDLSHLPGLFPHLARLETYQGETNLGYGRGQNFLARQRAARHLLLLNPDTRFIQPRTIERLLQRAVDSQAAVVGPRLQTPQGRTQRWDHGELHGPLAWLGLQSGHSYWRARRRPSEAAWVSGAALLIEKRWFDELCGFDEHFFLYKEDEELCWRIRERRGRILYDPSVSILHHGGSPADRSKHLQESTDYFLEKHFRGRFGYRLRRLLNRFIH